jgi:hypothetical protein
MVCSGAESCFHEIGKRSSHAKPKPMDQNGQNVRVISEMENYLNAERF